MAFGGRPLSGVRVAGFLLGAGILAAVGLVYASYISQQRQYIVGRDFRLLSNLAKQIDSVVDAEARVIMNLADDARGNANLSADKLRDRWVKLRGRPYQFSDISFVKGPPDASAPDYKVDDQLVLEVQVPLSGVGGKVWVSKLELLPGLEPIFTSTVGQGAFDAILLSTRDGRVLVGAGPTAQQIRSSGLGVLSSKPADGGKALAFADLAKSITMVDVSLAGVDYSVFLFPCCLSSTAGSRPLVLTGLVRADVLRSSSWAISTTLIKIAVLSLLVALVSWPFLKLILLGDRQQVRLSDFFQLGAASIVGLALLTVVLLDASAYLRLNRDVDVHLKHLADDLDNHAKAEVRDAYAQLECLEDKTGSLDTSKFDDGKVSSALQEAALVCESRPTWRSTMARHASGEDDRLGSGPELEWAYPFFETVAFIDRDGMQRVKLGTAKSVSNRISVGDRDYFSTVVRGRGWRRTDFCKDERCALESVWSWTSGEPRAVLAKESSLRWGRGDQKRLLPVAAITIPMRSLIGPVLPPGFTFAVINQTGKVLFHSDRRRNGNEDFFVETDNNRRLRAQIAAHSAEPLNIRYWGAEYRAYLKPMALPDMYVVAMAQKERAWAINREWLVVTLFFVAIYVGLWLIAAMATLGPNASWVWPDPARRAGYVRVSIVCAGLLVLAFVTAWYYDGNFLLILGLVVPLIGWVATYSMLKHQPTRRRGEREPLLAYSIATVLVLLVTAVVPGALLFLASYQLHSRSYIKNSQFIIAQRLSERNDRLYEKYLTTSDGKERPGRRAATQVGLMYDLDLYVDFLYDTSIAKASSRPVGAGDQAGHDAGALPWHEVNDLVLSFLEDYFPYYSEASVEWRELLHDSADDHSWDSRNGQKGLGAAEIVFTARTLSLPVALTSLVPSIMDVSPSRATPADLERPDEGLVKPRQSEALPTTGSTEVPYGNRDDNRTWSGTRDSTVLLLSAGLVLLILSWTVIQILNRRIYLVGISEPLWRCGPLAENAGENVLAICDKASMADRLTGMTPLKLGPIVRSSDITGAWQRELLAVDERNEHRAVLIDDFDECLEDAAAMEHKLALLDELVSDHSRTVILLSQVSIRGLTDSVRYAARVISAGRQAHAAAGQTPSATEASELPLERWRRILRAFVVVEWREDEDDKEGARKDPRVPHTERRSPAASEPPPASDAKDASDQNKRWPDRFDDLPKVPVVTFLMAEGRSGAFPYVRRVCEDLLRSNAVKEGRLTRRQAFDEVVEQTENFYRGLWESCSSDEKVVLGHIAQHGLANASVRGIVRRLLGRRLVCKDPALRPMNESFRRFVLTRECSEQVAVLETENGPSTWDRLRAPLGVAVVGLAVFLFATQKELYNAIFGVTTAAAASVPALIRAVGMLVGRPAEGPGTKTA